MKVKDFSNRGTELSRLELPLVSISFDLNEEFPIVRYASNDERKIVEVTLQKWQALDMRSSTVISKAEHVLSELQAKQASVVVCDSGKYQCVFSITKGKLNVAISFNIVDWIREFRDVIMQVAIVAELFAIELGLEYGGMLATAALVVIYENELPIAQEMYDRFFIIRAINRHTQDEIMDSNLIITYLLEYNLNFTQQTLYDFLIKLLHQHARMCIDPGQLVFQSRTPDKIKIIECDTFDTYFTSGDNK